MYKKIVLTFVEYYLPGYKSGGPVRTIANIVDHMSDDFKFKIITSDRDSFEPDSYENIKINAWNRVGRAEVCYLSPDKRNLCHLRAILNNTDYDILYFNSQFTPIFTIKPLLLRRLGLIPNKPVVIAPRGEFSGGALALKRGKKKAYLAFAKALGLYHNLFWQASSEHEFCDIQRVMGVDSRKIWIAPDLPSAMIDSTIQASQPSDSHDSSLKILFLSRISPMKNLDFALRVLAQVKMPVQFDLYGMLGDQDYWTQCRKLIKQLPDHIQVEYKGAIPHQEVLGTFAQYDLFFLPTRGENYGHAIYEALAAGTPALISDQTPWRDFDGKGVGWVFPLDDMDGFVRCIEKYSQTDVEARNLMRVKAREYAVDVNQNSETLQLNKELFNRALNMGV